MSREDRGESQKKRKKAVKVRRKGKESAREDEGARRRKRKEKKKAERKKEKKREKRILSKEKHAKSVGFVLMTIALVCAWYNMNRPIPRESILFRKRWDG